MENLGPIELIIISAICCLCSFPLVAGVITLVVILTQRGKKNETGFDRR